MAYARNASGRWAQLDGDRQAFLTRCEVYAGYTLPKLMTRVGYKQETDELSHDFQAVGAQATNHLANKIMLALFAPSRPFFRADPDKKLLAKAKALGMDETELTKLLAQGEKEAVTQLDRMALRPKLYEIIKQLIVLGNSLMCLEKDTFKVIGLRNYCVRRANSGKVLELMVAEKLVFDELDPDVQAHIKTHTNCPDDKTVTLYRWIKRDANGDYNLTQWVDEQQLPKQFSGKWPEDKLPYRALTWDLSSDAHYGTGLVEDYKSDFAGLSTLTRAQVMGAVLASEFRWLVNPAGATRPEDLENSENGACLPGSEGDVTLIQSNKAGDLQITMAMSSEYVTRIGRGFLLGASVTRQAERVTAEEIRMTANELETSLGGAYSRLAVDMQLPMAFWLMAIIGLGIGGTGIVPSVVTGLEALSRTGDLEDLKLWLGDMAAVAGLPEPLQAILNMDALAVDLAAPRRINVDKYIKSKEQRTQEAQAQQQQAQEQAATEAGINAAANAATQPQEGP